MTWSTLVTTSDPSMLHTIIEWFKSPETLLVVMRPWVLRGTMLIVLVKSGVLLPALPGESLLFTAGLFYDHLGLHLLMPILLVVIATFVRAQIGYFSGAKRGRRFFKPDVHILKTAHLERVGHYFTNHGGRSLVIGHLIPFMHTFIPIAAGTACYPYPKSLVLNTLGVVVWGADFILAGSLLGNVPFVHDNLTLILGVIILAPVLSVVIEVMGRRRVAPDKE